MLAEGWRYALLLQLWRVLPLPRWLRAQVLWRGNEHYLVAVAALIWDDQGRLLLGRHTYLPPPGWSLLGGWLHGAESLEAGLARELAEELGAEVEIGAPVAWAIRPTPRRLAVGFTCYWRGGAFQPNAEIAEVAYFTVEEALQMVRQDAQVMIKQALARRDRGQRIL